MQDKKYWFFGSKLNTALLLILIILMVIAIRIMLRNEQMYLGVWQQKAGKTTTVNNINIQDYVPIQNGQYENWKTYQTSEIYFMFPRNWSVESHTFETRPDSGYFITEIWLRSSDDHLIRLSKDVYAGANDPSNIYDIKTVGGYSFFIGKDASADTKLVFERIVASAKAI